MITCTPRSGSFLLCDALAASGIAGIPQEYASPEDVSSWRDFHGFPTHPAYFFAYPDLCRTPNQVCGVKLMWPQFLSWQENARRYLRSSASPRRLVTGLIGNPRLIRLVRRDVLRQAISWVRARQTGIWSRRRDDNDRAMHAATVRDSTPALAHYNASLLRDAIERISRQNHLWDDLAAQWNVPVLVVAYEDMIADYAAAVAAVLHFLALPARNIVDRPPALVRQADATSEEWVAWARQDLLPSLHLKGRERTSHPPGQSSSGVMAPEAPPSTK